jgi:uncharacterized membrane protein
MGTTTAAITVYRSRDEVEREWTNAGIDLDPTFKDAPGDRGTEIYVTVHESTRGGKIGEVVGKVTGSDPLAKAKDELRRFKALVETDVIPMSDGSPEGELAERKLKQQPAQPVEEGVNA